MVFVCRKEINLDLLLLEANSAKGSNVTEIDDRLLARFGANVSITKRVAARKTDKPTLPNILWSHYLARDLTHNWFTGLHFNLRFPSANVRTNGDFILNAYRKSRKQRQGKLYSPHTCSTRTNPVRIVMHYRAGDVLPDHPRFQPIQYVLNHLRQCYIHFSDLRFDVYLVSEGPVEKFKTLVQYAESVDWDVIYGGNVKVPNNNTKFFVNLGTQESVLEDLDILADADILFTSRSSFSHFGALFASHAVVVADGQWLCNASSYDKECVHPLIYNGMEHRVLFSQLGSPFDSAILKRMLLKRHAESPNYGRGVHIAKSVTESE